MTNLTKRQEDELFKEFVTEYFFCSEDQKADFLIFARLYHTEATKQTPKSEGVKSAETILKVKFQQPPSDGYNPVLQAMHEYAAQFQQGLDKANDVIHEILTICQSDKSFEDGSIEIEEKCHEYLVSIEPLPPPPNEQP